MLHVIPAGTRAGSTTLEASLASASVTLLGVESSKDSGASEGSSDGLPAGSLLRESPGDSGASGDSEALGDPEGLLEDDGLGEAVPPAPPDGLAVGLGFGVGVGVGVEDADGLEGLDAEADGDEVGEGLGEAVGDGVCEGDGLDEAAATGGATLGGTLAPDARSCCQDQPTEPPAGTVSEPTPYEE